MPFQLPVHRVCVMGVLNVTPDSFSDGGQFTDPEKALQHARNMVAAGADIIDVGGESTRPGAEPVDASEEIRRVIKVVTTLAFGGIAVSIDTSKPDVAKACLEAGAVAVNDVTALRDDDMASVCARAECKVCLMHMQGEPRTMQAAPTYMDVVLEVGDELVAAAERAIARGVKKDDIWIDPGIGFGKSIAHNLQLINNLGEIAETGYPVLVGVSRKSFIGKLLGPGEDPLPTEERLEGSIAAQVIAQVRGAKIIRTHDVEATVRSARIASAILSHR